MVIVFIVKLLHITTNMFWDEDVDLSLEKKITVKQGRRAGVSKPINDIIINDDVRPVTGKNGGWADEALKGKKNKSSNGIEQHFIKDISKVEKPEDAIPVIPDIDEFQDGQPTQVANAPEVSVNRTATYTEINNDLKKNISYSMLGDIDLSILLEALAPEEQIQSILADEEWSKEELMAELANEYYQRFEQ